MVRVFVTNPNVRRFSAPSVSVISLIVSQMVKAGGARCTREEPRQWLRVPGLIHQTLFCFSARRVA